MVDYYISDSVGRKLRKIQLSAAIAQGAAGTIHHVLGEQNVVVKLYKSAKDMVAHKDKVAAMLEARPNLPSIHYKGKEFIQIAWPIAAVVTEQADFAGFIMPEVDFQASTELENVLQRKVRRQKNIPEDYRLRVRLAANLASLAAELHAIGHYMIDMKPMNMRFYPEVQYMAILDTDGFSIGGKLRFPAHQFSDEYIAPEAQGKKPETLGIEQDLFALAVIIFRLLNNGLHPFQGVDIQTGNPTSLQERIFAQLYAYGLTPRQDVRPPPQSIHEFLETETRQLFDRAFLPSAGGRPTAAEWSAHVRNLVTRNILVSCRRNPDHGHFSKGCGFCALERKNTQLPPLHLRPALPFLPALKKGLRNSRAALVLLFGVLAAALYVRSLSFPIRPTVEGQDFPVRGSSSSSVLERSRQPSNEEAVRECIAQQLSSLELKLQTLDRSINENSKLGEVKSRLHEILGEEPKVERSRENIRNRLITSELRSSCFTQFHFLIQLVIDEDDRVKSLSASASHPPVGYRYDGLSRDYEAIRQKQAQEARDNATRACVARQSPLLEKKITSLLSRIVPPMTFWETKDLIDKSLDATSEFKETGSGDKLAYASIKLKCDSQKNYLYNLDADSVGRIKRIRFWVQDPGEAYRYLEAFTREYAIQPPMQLQEQAKAQEINTSSSSAQNSSQASNGLYESYWVLNESVMGLVRNGSKISFNYVQPRPGMADLVKAGTLWMDGTLEEGNFVGKARLYSKSCGTLEYRVSGSGNDDRITFSGSAPMVDYDCTVKKFIPVNDALVRKE